LSEAILLNGILNHTEPKEYVVTCISMDDLESLYDDLKNVELVKKRPLSKNTHYMLTSEEATQLKNDPRIKNVQLADFIKSSIKIAAFNQTSNFTKKNSSASIVDTDKNWGLLRCFKGKQITGWGDDTATNTINDTINRLYTGKNVDVIIVDGISSVPHHPEFYLDVAVDGVDSRYTEFNWYSLNGVVGNYPDTGGVSYYNYDDSSDPNSEAYKNHGTHVAGIVAGNTNGWATDASIYNISPYGFGGIDPLLIWDYIRAFHANKPINFFTGRKNPTICNCSYRNTFTNQQLLDFGFGTPIFGIFRGVGIGQTTSIGGSEQLSGVSLTEEELNRIGIITETGTTNFTFPYYDESIVSDITQALEDGIIVVGSSGNESFFIDKPDGVDYNNQLYFGYNNEVDELVLTGNIFYHKGSAPSAVPGVINVGAISADSTEKIATYTNRGTGITVFAPGDWIISSVATSAGSHDIVGYNNGTTTVDTRDTDYLLGRDSGTSAASAQVSGVIACILEQYPSLTPSQALSYVISNSSYFQIPQDSNDIYYTDIPVSNTSPTYFSTRIMNKNFLLGAENRYLKFRKLRPTVGELYPPQDYFIRPSTGIIYPRTNLRIVT